MRLIVTALLIMGCGAGTVDGEPLAASLVLEPYVAECSEAGEFVEWDIPATAIWQAFSCGPVSEADQWACAPGGLVVNTVVEGPTLDEGLQRVGVWCLNDFQVRLHVMHLAH